MAALISKKSLAPDPTTNLWNYVDSPEEAIRQIIQKAKDHPKPDMD